MGGGGGVNFSGKKRYEGIRGKVQCYYLALRGGGWGSNFQKNDIVIVNVNPVFNIILF